MAKSKTKDKVKDKMDNIHSLYVKHRDCQGGFGRCISCGTPITPKSCDNGHYMLREHMATRWDDHNCNAQCRECNVDKRGNPVGYRKGLIKKYGEGVVEELEQLSRTIVKFSENDIREKIKETNKKLKEVLR